MRKVLLALTAIVVAGCGKAHALVPDSTNPAHCMAAYNYGAYWLSLKPENRLKVAVELAKGMFEMNNIKSSGGSATAAQRQARQLTEAYANDSDKMDKLYVACSDALDRNPEFRKEFPALLQIALPMAAKYRSK